jgi:hypothetical protein
MPRLGLIRHIVIEVIGSLMFSHWAYILIGNNNTGKTSFQRNLVAYLCNLEYQRLPRNVVYDIVHPRAPKGLSTIFTCNRSYQEKASEYESVGNYFRKFFQDADVCILSSHTHDDSVQHVEEMIRHLKRRCYNVAGVFWSNDFGNEAQDIALLPWNEVLWIDNPILNNDDEIDEQLDRVARHFSELIIARAYAQ